MKKVRSFNIGLLVLGCAVISSNLVAMQGGANGANPAPKSWTRSMIDGAKAAPSNAKEYASIAWQGKGTLAKSAKDAVVAHPYKSLGYASAVVGAGYAVKNPTSRQAIMDYAVNPALNRAVLPAASAVKNGAVKAINTVRPYVTVENAKKAGSLVLATVATKKGLSYAAGLTGATAAGYYGVKGYRARAHAANVTLLKAELEKVKTSDLTGEAQAIKAAKALGLGVQVAELYQAVKAANGANDANLDAAANAKLNEVFAALN